MKKSASILFLLLIISNIVIAQGFYISASLGNAFASGGSISNIYGYPNSGNIDFGNNNTIINSYDVKKASYSAGIQSNIALGYMLNEHIGFELCLTNGLSPKQYTSRATGEYIDSYFVNRTFKQNAISPVYLTPSLFFQNNFNKINVYGKVGIVLPLSRNLNLEETDSFGVVSGFLNHAIYNQYIMKTNFSLGFSSTIGVSYVINNQLNVYGEISFMSLTLFVSELDNASYMQDGQSYSASPPISFGFTGKNVNPSTQTGTQITEGIPFSNIGLNIGLSYSFSKHFPKESKTKSNYFTRPGTSKF